MTTTTYTTTKYYINVVERVVPKPVTKVIMDGETVVDYIVPRLGAEKYEDYLWFESRDDARAMAKQLRKLNSVINAFESSVDITTVYRE